MFIKNFYSATLNFFLAKSEKPLFLELYEYFKEKYFSGRLGEYDNFHFGTGSLITYNIIVVAMVLGMIIASIFMIYNKRYLGNFVRKLLNEPCDSKENAKTLEELGLKHSLGIRLGITGGKMFRNTVKCVEADEYYASLTSFYGDISDGTSDSTSDDTSDIASGDANENKKAAQSKNAENNENILNENADIESVTIATDKSDAKTEKPEQKTEKITDISAYKPYKYDLANDHFYIPYENKFRAEVKFAKKGTNLLVLFFIVLLSGVIAAGVCFLIPEMLQLLDNFLNIIK